MKEKEDQSKGKETFPEDPLKRCNLRWDCLFWGIWRSLNEKDKRYRRIKLGIIEALKRFGLFGDQTFPSELFELNPTDEILRRTVAFKKTPWIPKVRGKKLPWEGYQPFIALLDYSSTLFILGKLPPRIRYRADRFLRIKELLPEILKKMCYKVENDVPENILREWIRRLPRRELAVRLVAYIHGFKEKHEAFRKYLTAARKEHPELWSKNGMEMIESK